MRNRWKQRMGAAVLLTAFMGLLPVGCGMFEEEAPEIATEETVDEDLIEVGFSQIGSESKWRTANTESIQNALTKENGYFLIYNNARQKQENQIKAIRSYISQRVDYIVFSPVMEEGWETVLEEAKEADIPVIIVDRMVSVKDDSLYTTWVGTDARAEGENAAIWLEEYLEENGRSEEEINIVVLQGTTGASVQLGRTMGFDSIADTHANWHILEQKSADFTTAKGKEVMQQFLKNYPDIDVVFSQNDDMSFGAIEAMEEAGITPGKDVILLSVDATKEALEMVRDGIINVDVECNPEQGAEVAAVIQKLERGEEVEKSYIVEEKIFTKDNVEQYLEERTY